MPKNTKTIYNKNKKNNKNKNKTKRNNKCIYTDEAKRLINEIKLFKRTSKNIKKNLNTG